MKFLAVRYALSILCFGVWIVLSGVRWPSSRAQWGHLAVTGVLMHAGYLGGVWAAVKAGMGAGLSSLIVGLQPVLTAVWLSATGARVSPRQWTGLVLGFVGLLLVVSRKFGQGSAGDSADWLNLSLAVLALMSITVGTLYQKRHVQPCDVRSANAVQLAAALVVTLPLALLETEAMRWVPELGAAMAWSVLGMTLGGSSLLYLLIQRGAATTVTSLLVSGAAVHRCVRLAVVWRAHHAADPAGHGFDGGGRQPRGARGKVAFQGSLRNCSARWSMSRRSRRGTCGRQGASQCTSASVMDQVGNTRCRRPSAS
jgi:drug/metabolite transporter (DMT)-like permease